MTKKHFKLLYLILLAFVGNKAASFAPPKAPVIRPLPAPILTEYLEELPPPAISIGENHIKESHENYIEKNYPSEEK
jgi:hypothetical protein